MSGLEKNMAELSLVGRHQQGAQCVRSVWVRGNFMAPASVELEKMTREQALALDRHRIEQGLALAEEISRIPRVRARL